MGKREVQHRWCEAATRKRPLLDRTHSGGGRWREPTLDGEPGGVLSLTKAAAGSADVNAFVTLLQVLNPAETHQITSVRCWSRHASLSSGTWELVSPAHLSTPSLTWWFGGRAPPSFSHSIVVSRPPAAEQVNSTALP